MLEASSVLCLALASAASASLHLLPMQVVDQQGFVYLKGSEIHFHLLNMQLESHQAVLQAAYHGREANCVTVLKDRSKGELSLSCELGGCIVRNDMVLASIQVQFILQLEVRTVQSKSQSTVSLIQ